MITIVDLTVPQEDEGYKRAKGRIGYFNPARAVLTLPMKVVVDLSICSSSQRGEPPIWVELTPEQAEALGQGLIGAANEARKHV